MKIDHIGIATNAFAEATSVFCDTLGLSVGETEEVPVILRIDTPIELDYYQHGGILPFVLRQLLAGTTDF